MLQHKVFFLLIFALLSSSFSKAQFTMHPMLHAGYVYQNQSFAEIGGRALFLKKDDVLFRVGASALLGKTNDKFAIMPKLQGDVLFNFQRGVDIYHSYYFLAGAEATTKYVAPKLGLSVFGIIDITGGYAFSIPNQTLNNKKLNGFNFNFTVNIPLVVIEDLSK